MSELVLAITAMLFLLFLLFQICPLGRPTAGSRAGAIGAAKVVESRKNRKSIAFIAKTTSDIQNKQEKHCLYNRNCIEKTKTFKETLPLYVKTVLKNSLDYEGNAFLGFVYCMNRFCL